MKKFLTLCTVLTLVFAFAMSISFTACNNGGGDGGGDDSSAVIGPRYVFSTDISGTTSVFTLKFTGDTINESGGNGVAHREDFTTSTMAFIPGHRYQCNFTYTVSGDTVTINWPSEIIALTGDASCFDNNAWSTAYHFGFEATGSNTFANSIDFTKTGNNLAASYLSRVWEYRE